MKKLALFTSVVIALLLASCVKEPAPEYSTKPEISIVEASLPGTDPTVPSGQYYMVQANVTNKYGVCYVWINYDVEWTETDETGTTTDKKEELNTNKRTYRESTGDLYYEGYIPGLNAAEKNSDLKVSWVVSVENEYGLKATTEIRTYTVINPNTDN